MLVTIFYDLIITMQYDKERYDRERRCERGDFREFVPARIPHAGRWKLWRVNAARSDSERA